MVLYHAVVKRKKVNATFPFSSALPNHEPKGSNKTLEKYSDETRKCLTLMNTREFNILNKTVKMFYCCSRTKANS